MIITILNTVVSLRLQALNYYLNDSFGPTCIFLSLATIVAVSITEAISTSSVTTLIEFIGNPHGCKELKKVPAMKMLITVN
jgi:hypothetical protein